MAHDVFISCTAADKPVGDAICATLEANNIRCWIAPRDILPGQDWGGSIIKAITNSRAMVLVFSSSANASEHIKREVERAVNAGIAIIPVRIEQVMPEGALEYFLSTPHWLDAFTGELAEHLVRLVEVVRQILDYQATSTPVIVPTLPPRVSPQHPTRPLVDADALLDEAIEEFFGGGSERNVKRLVTRALTAGMDLKLAISGFATNQAARNPGLFQLPARLSPVTLSEFDDNGLLQTVGSREVYFYAKKEWADLSYCHFMAHEGGVTWKSGDADKKPYTRTYLSDDCANAKCRKQYLFLGDDYAHIGADRGGCLGKLLPMLHWVACQ